MTIAYKLSDIRVEHANNSVLTISQLRISSGCSVALLGENGAGKTSLINLLAFTAQATHGSIQLFGDTVHSALSATQRRRIGYVSQQPYLLPGTVADNIQLALKLQGIDHDQFAMLTQQALEQVNLAHLAHQLINTLSGGELKRIAIARAIAYQPDILLLDEPFSHLDQRHIQQLEMSLNDFTQQVGKTVIFSTHDRFQAQALADKTINLVAGKITDALLLNLFSGQLTHSLFNIGKLNIHVSSTQEQARHIAIDPREIRVFSQPFPTSMRNNFEGRLTLIAEEGAAIRLTIECGERFHVLLSPDVLACLNLKLGDAVWLSFESTAVTLF